VILATAGAVIYFLPASFGVDQRLGLAAALAGITANAAAAILGRDVNRSGRWPPLIVGVSMLAGSVLLLGVGLAVEGLPDYRRSAWRIIVWLAIFSTALAFTLWNQTARSDGRRSSVINGTMLIWIPILAAAFLETLTNKELGGLALVAVGTVLVQLRRFPRRPAPKTEGNVEA
jgi:drug/metabolite transporter (DMT)-like permease